MFRLYDGLPFFDQVLHDVHFTLCVFAVLVAGVPLFTQKGSAKHKWGGLIYVPVSGAAFLLACLMAWREASLVLFCFNGFCAYLLLSGWRAVREQETPALIDWLIPGGLFILAVVMAAHALMIDEGKRSFFLLFFAFNGIYLGLRDLRAVHFRARWLRHRKFFAKITSIAPHAMDWMNRHVAGMVGSVMANMSVVVLTVLPIAWHWIWPAALVMLTGFIALRQVRKKARARRALAPVLHPRFRPRPEWGESDEDVRRIA